MVCRTAPAPRCVSCEYRCRGDPNRGFVRRSHQNCKGAEGGFAGETRGSNLRRIPPPESERVRRRWIPITSFLTFCNALPFAQRSARESFAEFENAVLENDRFREDRHQALPDSQVEGLTVL